MNEPQENGNGNGNRRQAVTIAPARLPYHPALEERFGVGQAEWRALVDAIFPLAKEAESIILALSYCRARKLDPFKRVVHIVPMWNAALGRMVETVWPGIGELRTTAFRTRQYAGRDNAEFGPTLTKQVGSAAIDFPEWCQVTAYRILNGERYPFPGPRVYWMECYATTKKDDATPNSMWRKRPFGQLDKCAEAAALRAAFPEEIGNDYTNDEMEGRTIGVDQQRIVAPKRTLDEKLDAIAAGSNGEPPHDPETGEIVGEELEMARSSAVEQSAVNRLVAGSNPAVPAEPTGEDAARQLAAKLEERAAKGSNPSHDPNHAKVKDAGVAAQPPTIPASDPLVEKVLDVGRAAATNGSAKYMRWENNLSAPDFERIKPYIKEMRKAAGAPEWTGA